MEPIAAIATGNSVSAIGIVRLSGTGCFSICDRVFCPVSPTNSINQTLNLPARKMIFGEMLDREGRVIDRGLAVQFPGPHSYTGEDCVEFHCHGSPIVLRELLSALFAAGARQAGPGEFTKRAFLNGRMDLTQAEAVIDLIDAETAAAARNAVAQLDGGLRRILDPIQDALLEITSRFYAVVDYPDEEIEDVQPEQIDAVLQDSDKQLNRLLNSCHRGKLLKQGVRTAIVGLPNAGKSALLNALVGYDRAIVTELPGTTRDTIEESVLCGGVLLRLIDTAGIRDADNMIEQKGIERSRRALESADLILLVIDKSKSCSSSKNNENLEAELLKTVIMAKKPWILIFSKRDLTQMTSTDAYKIYIERKIQKNNPAAILSLSAVTGEGIEELEQAIADYFPAGDSKDAGSLLTDQRQEDAVQRALDAIRRASHALLSGWTPDAVLTDVEDALNAIGELTGCTAKEEIVSQIFSRFCVGK